MNYTYIVKCADSSYYTGWTVDLEKRMDAHNSGKGAKYTRNKGPVELVYYEEFVTKQEAMSREWHIKKLSRAKKQELIENAVDLKGTKMKKDYKFILWDMDDTLMDFKVSEKVALIKCFREYEVELSDDDIEVYSKINHDYWKMLELGKIEKELMLIQRFTDFIKYLGIEGVKGAIINKEFQMSIGDHVVMYEGAMKLCESLKGVKSQYAVTNGTIIAQERKLKNTGLDKIFDGVFISDKIGYQKPDLRFFQHVFSNIPDFKVEEAIIIGDSLSSDMKGGNNAGIDCCWYNPRNAAKEDGIRIDYEVKNIADLYEIVADHKGV